MRIEVIISKQDEIHDTHIDCVRWMIDTIRYQKNTLIHGKCKLNTVSKSESNEQNSMDLEELSNERNVLNLWKVDSHSANKTTLKKTSQTRGKNTEKQLQVLWSFLASMEV